MLRPLAFDEDLAERMGSGARQRGYIILRNTLLQSCVLDLVKLTIDASPRTPSALNLITTLEDGAVRRRLLEDYAVAPPPPLSAGDPLPRALLADIKADEERRLTEDFESVWSALSTRWPSLRDNQRLAGFKIWRDKLIAHSDLHHADGEYCLTDLTAEGLEWGDLDALIGELQEVVDSITILTRSAGFAWGTLREQLDAASDGFWDLGGQTPTEGKASNT